uniref:Uncharacterized protein n=1 Tax=Physcomitrium patens TaxID=3218 RepID=A0A2K1IJ35_PHYPA|nr:hypothetical protein PHYPA_027978 [Physcomitrium patens]
MRLVKKKPLLEEDLSLIQVMESKEEVEGEQEKFQESLQEIQEPHSDEEETDKKRRNSRSQRLISSKTSKDSIEESRVEKQSIVFVDEVEEMVKRLMEERNKEF